MVLCFLILMLSLVYLIAVLGLQTLQLQHGLLSLRLPVSDLITNQLPLVAVQVLSLFIEYGKSVIEFFEMLSEHGFELFGGGRRSVVGVSWSFGFWHILLCFRTCVNG